MVIKFEGQLVMSRFVMMRVFMQYYFLTSAGSLTFIHIRSHFHLNLTMRLAVKNSVSLERGTTATLLSSFTRIEKLFSQNN